MYGSMFDYNNATNAGEIRHMINHVLNFSNNYVGSGCKYAFLDVTDVFHNALSSEKERTTSCAADVHQLNLYRSICSNKNTVYVLSSGSCLIC